MSIANVTQSTMTGFFGMHFFSDFDDAAVTDQSCRLLLIKAVTKYQCKESLEALESFEEAELYLDDKTDLSYSDKILRAKIQNNIGTILIGNGQFLEASECFIDAFQICETMSLHDCEVENDQKDDEMHMLVVKSRILINASWAFYAIKEYRQASELCKHSFDVLEDLSIRLPENMSPWIQETILTAMFVKAQLRIANGDLDEAFQILFEIYKETSTCDSLQNHPLRPIVLVSIRKVETISWEKCYSQLCEYKANHGSCNLSQSNSSRLNPNDVSSGTPDPNFSKALYDWTQQQRKQYKLSQEGCKSQLTKDRIDLLNKIGFDWRLKMTKGVHVKR